MSYLKINFSIEFPMDSIPHLEASSSEQPIRLGSYLIEAGLITPAQVAVVLNDQNFSHDMRFGEVLVARGWVKSETIEFVVKRVLEPERKAALDRQNASARKSHPQNPTQNPAQNPASRQTRPPTARVPSPPPIAPPLPTTPPKLTTPPIARAKSLDGDFEFEILDDITLSLPDSNGATGVRNDRKPLSSIPDGGGVNWAG